MAPERAGMALKRGQPAGEDRRVEAGRELHGPAEARLRFNDLGQRLQQAQLRVRLHPPHHLGDGATLHQAVGIEDQRKLIGRAGPLDEILDIAGLLAGVHRAAAVEHPPLRPPLGNQPQEPAALGGRDLVIAGVGEDGEVELVGQPEGGERGIHRRHPRQHRGRLLVIDRDQNGRAPADQRHIFGQGRNDRRAAAREQPQQALTGAPGQPESRQQDQPAAEPIHRLQPVAGTVLQEECARGKAKANGQHQRKAARSPGPGQARPPGGQGLASKPAGSDPGPEHGHQPRPDRA